MQANGEPSGWRRGSNGAHCQVFCSSTQNLCGNTTVDEHIVDVFSDSDWAACLENPPVQVHHEFVNLTEKIPCEVHHFSDRVRGDPHWSSYTKASQAKSLIPMQGEFSENNNKFRSSWKYEPTEQFEENRKVNPNSPKRNIIREFFLRNTEVNSQRQISNYFCRR